LTMCKFSSFKPNKQLSPWEFCYPFFLKTIMASR
jgi:hypothetical protein